MEFEEIQDKTTKITGELVILVSEIADCLICPPDIATKENLARLCLVSGHKLEMIRIMTEFKQILFLLSTHPQSDATSQEKFEAGYYVTHLTSLGFK